MDLPNQKVPRRRGRPPADPQKGAMTSAERKAKSRLRMKEESEARPKLTTEEKTERRRDQYRKSKQEERLRKKLENMGTRGEGESPERTILNDRGRQIEQLI